MHTDTKHIYIFDAPSSTNKIDRQTSLVNSYIKQNHIKHSMEFRMWRTVAHCVEKKSMQLAFINQYIEY